MLRPGQAQGLNPKESTIARQLKQVGYNTKIIGKWHCGDDQEFLPTGITDLTNILESRSAMIWGGR